MLFRGNQAKRHCWCTLSDSLCSRFKATVGESPHQTLWEFMTLCQSLLRWMTWASDAPLIACGDRIGALHDALSLKGMAIAREIAWRQARCQWRFTVAHLPNALNWLADALSRQTAEPLCAYPQQALNGAIGETEMDMDRVWCAWQ